LDESPGRFNFATCLHCTQTGASSHVRIVQDFSHQFVVI
jgi:hypothetical protein